MKQIKREEKKKRDRDTNKRGGSDPIVEVNSHQFSLFEGGPFDFSGLHMDVLTDAYGGLQIMAIGLMLWDAWPA